MSSTSKESSLPSSAPPGTTIGAQDTVNSSEATPAMSVGSATAFGHGQHPPNKGDDSNAVPSSSKYGVQKEDLEGDAMATFGEDQVAHAQLDKKAAGWGEQKSLTSDLDRMKQEQESKREQVKAARRDGNLGDSDVGRLENEGLGAA